MNVVEKIHGDKAAPTATIEFSTIADMFQYVVKRICELHAKDYRLIETRKSKRNRALVFKLTKLYDIEITVYFDKVSERRVGPGTVRLIAESALPTTFRMIRERDDERASSNIIAVTEILCHLAEEMEQTNAANKII